MRDPGPKTESYSDYMERLAFENPAEYERQCATNQPALSEGFNYPGPDTPVLKNLKEAYAAEKAIHGG